jgi:drug/metabolite transporter (DMT)-like permease
LVCETGITFKHRTPWRYRTPLPIVPAMSETAPATPAAASARPNRVLVGVAWMIGSGACFATMAGLIRYLSADLHAFEIAFFRNVAGVLVMLPWLMRVGIGGLRTRRFGLYVARGATSILAMLSFFWALTAMPITEATALNFTMPIFATILAVIFLGEVVRARRWTAILVGFAGVMLILRPGLAVIGLPALMALFGALMVASSVIIIRRLSTTESPNAIVLYMGLFLIPLSLPPALFVWRDPTWLQLGLGGLIGVFGTAAHQCYTRAIYAAEASIVMPFDFARLLFVAIIGYLAFGQTSDMWTWIGAVVIVGAGVYIAQREARLGRAAAAPAPPEA